MVFRVAAAFALVVFLGCAGVGSPDASQESMSWSLEEMGVQGGEIQVRQAQGGVQAVGRIDLRVTSMGSASTFDGRRVSAHFPVQFTNPVVVILNEQGQPLFEVPATVAEAASHWDAAGVNAYNVALEFRPSDAALLQGLAQACNAQLTLEARVDWRAGPPEGPDAQVPLAPNAVTQGKLTTAREGGGYSFLPVRCS